jgi:hypothetical protein
VGSGGTTHSVQWKLKLKHRTRASLALLVSVQVRARLDPTDAATVYIHVGTDSC